MVEVELSVLMGSMKMPMLAVSLNWLALRICDLSTSQTTVLGGVTVQVKVTFSVESKATN